MSRVRTSLCLLIALALISGTIGAVLHVHDDAGNDCRLCQSGHERVATGALHVAHVAPDDSVDTRRVTSTRRAVAGIVVTPGLMRAPPAA